MSDPVAVALSVARVMEERGLRYLVGGSLASSISGEPRSTLDVDIVVAVTPADADRLIEGLRAEFDVDERALAGFAPATRGLTGSSVMLLASSWCREALDRAYLDDRAERLGLSDLLERADRAVRSSRT